MAMASKKMAEKKQSESVQDRDTKENGVVITVYVESVTTRSRKLSEEPIEKTKPHPHLRRPRAAGSQGYDRRAQLLAHSQHLRNGGSQKVQLPMPINQSQPKSKKVIWLTQPVRICSCLPSTQMAPRPRSSSRCRYERMASKESKETNESKKRNAKTKICSPFLGKLRNMLNKLSCKEIKW